MVATVMIVPISHPLSGRQSDESSESMLSFSRRTAYRWQGEHRNVSTGYELDGFGVLSPPRCFQVSWSAVASRECRRSQLDSFGIPNRSHVGCLWKARTIIPLRPRY